MEPKNKKGELKQIKTQQVTNWNMRLKPQSERERESKVH